jgi:hypothetical protein
MVYSIPNFFVSRLYCTVIYPPFLLLSTHIDPTNSNFSPYTSLSLLPHTQAAKVYAALADDVITEILTLQLEAQGTPSLSLVKGKGLALRYFTSTQVRG